MKIRLLAVLLSTQVVCAAAFAQTPDSPSGKNEQAGVVPLPIIDARAHRLLAQVVQKYQRAKTFSGTVRMHTKGNSDLPWARYEVQAQRWNQARIVATEPRGVTTTISDGHTVFSTHSRFKNQYTKTRFSTNDSPTFNSMEALFHRTLEGSLKELLTGDDLAAALLDPYLQEFSLAPDSENSPLATIVIRWNSPAQQASTHVEIKIRRDDSIIEEILTTDVFRGNTFIARETFSNVKINQPLPASLFAFTPKKGARLVSDFNDFVVTTTPPSTTIVEPVITQPAKKKTSD